MTTLQEVVFAHIHKKIDEKMEETIQNKVMEIVNKKENYKLLQGHVIHLGKELIVPPLDYTKSAEHIELGTESAKQLCEKSSLPYVQPTVKQHKNLSSNQVGYKTIIPGGASRKRKPRKQRISRRRKISQKQHGGTIDENIAAQLGELGKLFTNAMDKNIPMYKYILQQPEKVMEELQKTLNVSVKEIKENRTFMYELFRLIICEFDEKIKINTFVGSGGITTPEKLKQVMFTTTFHKGIEALNTTLTIDGEKQGAKEIVELLMKKDTVIKYDLGEYCNQLRNPVKNTNKGLLTNSVDTLKQLVPNGIFPNNTSLPPQAASS